MTDDPSIHAMALAKSRLQELTLRVQELEHALRNMAVMLPSDCPERDDSERIPPGFVYIRWIDLREARSVLNKETSRA